MLTRLTFDYRYNFTLLTLLILNFGIEGYLGQRPKPTASALSISSKNKQMMLRHDFKTIRNDLQEENAEYIAGDFFCFLLLFGFFWFFFLSLV